MEANWEVKNALVEVAQNAGADLIGFVPVEVAMKWGVYINPSIFPTARTIISLAVAHSEAALNSGHVPIMQYDTNYTYQTVTNAQNSVVRHLQAKGYPSLAIPPFIPIDMGDEGLGMKGAVDLKAAGVAAGIGEFGASGMLITPQYGPRVRLGAVLTEAIIPVKVPETPPVVHRHSASKMEICTNCGNCQKNCPSKALEGSGKINKHLCGECVFEFGLRHFVRFLEKVVSQKDAEKLRTMLRSRETREIWHNFMTGNYYYCWRCQETCPVGKMSAGSSIRKHS